MAENSPPKPRSVAHKQRRNQDSRPHDARFPVKLSPPIRRSHHESVCYRGTFNAFESLPVSRQLCFAGFVSRSGTLCFFIAPTRFAVLAEKRVVGFVLRVPSAESTASCPATAASTASGSSTLPRSTRGR